VSGGAAETQAARVEKPAEMRWRAVCQYVGTQLEGWQAQPSKRAVQDFLEKRLAQIFGRQIRIHGSGRTDSGVHARGQVFHFDADWKHGRRNWSGRSRRSARRDPDPRAAAGAAGLPRALFGDGKALRLFPAPRARGSVRRSVLCWSLGGRPLDVEAMRAAARLLVGRHDFRAFSAFNGEEREDTVKTLRRLDVLGRGQKLRIVAEADGFLYKMVRTLVGALVGVGLGKLKPEQVAALLDGRKRTHLVETAPAQGLFLWRVEYGRKR
jgi:tRNA pseudouridine38-40 synthase